MRKALCSALLLTMTSLGCNNGSIDDDATDDTDSDTDQSANNDGFTPYVEQGHVFCYDSGDSAGIIWNWLVYANDEQGPFTIKSLNKLGAYTVQGDAEIFKQSLLACNDEGKCSGSLREDQAGILCGNHEQYVFKAFIEDADGNVSEPTALVWSDTPPE
jgi:hypothetical protein